MVGATNPKDVEARIRTRARSRTAPPAARPRPGRSPPASRSPALRSTGTCASVPSVQSQVGERHAPRRPGTRSRSLSLASRSTTLVLSTVLSLMPTFGGHNSTQGTTVANTNARWTLLHGGHRDSSDGARVCRRTISGGTNFRRLFRPNFVCFGVSQGARTYGDASGEPDEVMTFFPLPASGSSQVPIASGSKDGRGCADHDQPYSFGRRPREAAPFPFTDTPVRSSARAARSGHGWTGERRRRRRRRAGAPDAR